MIASDRFDHLFFSPRDFDVSRQFYVEILNWQVMSEWTDNHGKRGAILNGGGIRVMLAERRDGDKIQNVLAPHASTLHLDIHDADKRFAQIPSGSHIVQTPETNQWGSRWFVVQDPDGNLIAFDEMRQRS